jgi:glycosyltransferase involved in cell wall biosynthesis
VHVIPNAADLEFFNPGNDAGLRFRERFDWLADRPLVLYAGSLGRINGVDYLARLAAAAQRLDPEVRFLVVGTGAELEKVRYEAQRLAVLDRSFFMLEMVPKSEMPAVISAATMATSLFVDLPQMWANSANKFFDALAAGRPVAINYQGWQADLLRETGAGIVLDVSDAEKAAQQIVRCLHDAAWLQQAGKSARGLAEQQFDREKLTRQLEAVLADAVQQQ